MNVSAKCPSCSTMVNLGRKPRLYKRFTCSNCEASLEVVSRDPPVLDWVREYDKYYSVGESKFGDELIFAIHW
jgi:lysine biosynthesis protein LysW